MSVNNIPLRVSVTNISAPSPPPSSKQTDQVAQEGLRGLKRKNEEVAQDTSSPRRKFIIDVPYNYGTFITCALDHLVRKNYELAIEEIKKGYEVHPRLDFADTLISSMRKACFICPGEILIYVDQRLSEGTNLSDLNILKCLAMYKHYSQDRDEGAREPLVRAHAQEPGHALVNCLLYYFLVQRSITMLKKSNAGAFYYLIEAHKLHPYDLRTSLKKKCPEFKFLLSKMPCTNIAEQELVRFLREGNTHYKMKIPFLLNRSPSSGMV